MLFEYFCCIIISKILDILSLKVANLNLKFISVRYAVISSKSLSPGQLFTTKTFFFSFYFKDLNILTQQLYCYTIFKKGFLFYLDSHTLIHLYLVYRYTCPSFLLMMFRWVVIHACEVSAHSLCIHSGKREPKLVLLHILGRWIVFLF